MDFNPDELARFRALTRGPFEATLGASASTTTARVSAHLRAAPLKLESAVWSGPDASGVSAHLRAAPLKHEGTLTVSASCAPRFRALTRGPFEARLCKAHRTRLYRVSAHLRAAHLRAAPLKRHGGRAGQLGDRVFPGTYARPL